MICLRNNFHQLAAKNDFKQPEEPLWFLKAPNSYWSANRPIERPATYAGQIIYEGEPGIVIGKSPHLRTLEYITGMNGDHIAFQCANAGFSALFQANPFCHVRSPTFLCGPESEPSEKENCIKNEI
jgi:fumarylacetoacetase-like protein